jgi:hypothetical protein
MHTPGPWKLIVTAPDVEATLIEWARSEAAMVKAIGDFEGRKEIPKGSPADLACDRWSKAGEAIRNLAHKLAEGKAP